MNDVLNKTEPIGRSGKIGTEQIREAVQILQKYKQGKANLERRVVSDEEWYKMRHWDEIAAADYNVNEPRPASAWLFNAIANKHADAMDNYPEPNVLPREESDKEDAKILSEILPVILERNGFEQTYSDTWWNKLKNGTGVYGVYWNNALENGLGDIDIKQLDLLNIFWEPGITDIQKSRNLFTVELVDNDILRSQYEFLGDTLGTKTVDVAQYRYDDSVDTSDKSAVIDWYYKVSDGSSERLHYVKFVNDTVIYASENDPNYADRGYYDHGKYPVVFDTMFVTEGTPAGFGYIDAMKDVQMYIDKLNAIIIKNAFQAGKRRFFINDNGGVNEDEFADWSRDFVHVSGRINDDNIKEITVSQLDSSVMNMLTQKIDELKETSGNRDFSQGSTSGGVTAASAIAALQEAGSKLSRDMIKSAYRAFTKINYFVIELIRQFYDETRSFRIIGANGESTFVKYSNERIREQIVAPVAAGDDVGYRRPIFDIKVTSQKASPFSKVAQNELAKELYNMGFFNPALAEQSLTALEMMDFEAKDIITDKITQNAAMYQQIQQLQMQVQQLTAALGGMRQTDGGGMA